MKARILSVLVLALAATAAAAQAEMSGQQIVMRMERERQKIKDYTAQLTIAFDMPQMRVAPMKVKVFYKHPDRVKAEPLSGFAIIPKRGLTMQWPQPDLTNVDIDVSRVQFAGRPAYLLAVSRRDGSPSAGGTPTAGRLWVDRERWVPLKFEVGEPVGAPGAARSGLSVEAHYTRVGGHWLPAKVTVETTMPGADKKQEEGTITLEFSKYKVNSGLSDKLFEEKPKR